LRRITHHYLDPLDQIWISTAARVGFRVTRTADAYASTDGRRTVAIGVPEVLDADDCLAQMILHELCHALVEGESAWERPDWGLDNQTTRDEPREDACLRTQAALTAPWGLRAVLAPTTDHRPIYDALPADPVDRPLVRLALRRAESTPFAPHLGAALAATARILREAQPFAGESLGGLIEPERPRHPSGFFAAAAGSRAAGERCDACAWWSGKRCRPSRRRLPAGIAACERWEPALDCQDCGACCREAYGAVHVAPREPIIKRHPSLVVFRDGYVELARSGERCAALVGTERYACTVYEDRPRTCRDFTLGGGHCLTARRRTGLTR
jgi:hypothetical protein